MNYGDVIAKALDKPVLAYEEFGSYQGDYIAVIDGGDSVEIYKGSYGSCSGCDWLEAEQDWEDDWVLSKEKATEYMKDEKPFIVIPKKNLETLTPETLEAILPANSRLSTYDDVTYKEIVEMLINLNNK